MGEFLFWLSAESLVLTGGLAIASLLDYVFDLSAFKDALGFGGEPEWYDDEED